MGRKNQGDACVADDGLSEARGHLQGESLLRPYSHDRVVPEEIKRGGVRSEGTKSQMSSAIEWMVDTFTPSTSLGNNARNSNVSRAFIVFFFVVISNKIRS